MKTQTSPSPLQLLILCDLFARRIANNRTGIYRLMKREDDPFPKPILISEGRPIEGTTRFAGRKVAWVADEVEKWLSRRKRAGH
jgi:predicted DNA-binding transcriptional regulator AlpA